MDCQKLPDFINHNLEGLEKTSDRICEYLKGKACDLKTFEDALRIIVAKGTKDKALRDFLYAYFTLVYFQTVMLPSISTSRVGTFSYKAVPFWRFLAKRKSPSHTVSSEECPDNSPHFTPSQE